MKPALASRHGRRLSYHIRGKAPGHLGPIKQHHTSSERTFGTVGVSLRIAEFPQPTLHVRSNRVHLSPANPSTAPVLSAEPLPSGLPQPSSPSGHRRRSAGTAYRPLLPSSHRPAGETNRPCVLDFRSLGTQISRSGWLETAARPCAHAAQGRLVRTQRTCDTR